MGYGVTLAELSGLNILLALSVYATLMVGQFSLAQVGFWAIGAFATGVLTTLYAVPLVPALLVSGASCAVIGLILGYPCLRIRGIYLTLATVAFSEVVRVFFQNFVWRVKVDGVPIGPDGPVGFRGIVMLTAWPQILVAVLIAMLVFWALERSRAGLAANAVREDEVAAACMGVRVVMVKVSSFAFGAFVAGVGGGLYATYVSYVSSDNFDFHLALISIFFVAVGGTRSFVGPVLGAVLLTILPEALRFAGDFRMALYGVVVIVVMILAPRGIADTLRLPRSRSSGRTTARAGVFGTLRS